MRPLFGKDGKPLVDRWGRQMHDIIYEPVSVAPREAGADRVQPFVDMAKSMVEAERERAKAAREEAKVAMEEAKELRGELYKDLRERVESVERFKSPDYVVDMATKLKNLGLFGTSPETLEAVKVKADVEKWKTEQTLGFEKWKHEQDMSLKKWLAEQDTKMKEMEMAREQMSQLGESLRKGISEVGAPLAQAAAGGIRDRLARGGVPVRLSPEQEAAILERKLKEAEELKKQIKIQEAQWRSRLQELRATTPPQAGASS